MAAPGVLLIGVGALGIVALVSGNLDRLLERLAGSPPSAAAPGTAPPPVSAGGRSRGGSWEAAVPVGSGSSSAGVGIARLAHRAGFRGDALVTALAVARGESGWRADAVGDTALADAKWGPSLGLWQVRCLRAETGTGGPRDCAALRDPGHNARSAYSISASGTNWRPWTIYTNGSWRNHAAAARAAIAAAGVE